MPSEAASRNVPRFVKWSMITCAIGIGGGYAFGPPSLSSSTTFDVLRSITWFPISAWGWLFMFSGFLMMTTKMTGHALAMVAWSTWGLGILIAAFDGRLSGWGGTIWPFFFVAINAYEVFRWGQKRLQVVRTEQIGNFREARRRLHEEGR